MPRSVRGAVRLAPVVAIAFTVLVLATHLGSITNQLGWNGDVASRYMLGDTLTHNGAHGRVFSTQVAYAWIDSATTWLPGHRTIWQAYPFAIVAMALGVLTWTLWRIAGRNVALLVAALAVGATPAILLSETAQGFHGLAYAAMIAIDGLLVATALSKRPRGMLRVAGAAAFVIGAVAATDPLLVLIGIAPAGAASLAVLLRHRRQQWVRSVAGAGALLAIGSGLATVAALLLLRHFGFEDLIPGGSARTLVSLSALGDHVKAAGTGLLDLGAGLPYDSGSIVPWRAAVGALLVLAFGAASIVVVWRALRSDLSPALTLHATFWSVGAILLFAAFVGGDVVKGGVYLEPTGRLLGSVRYLVPLFFVGTALAPLWAVDRPGRVAILTAAVLVFVAWSGVAVAQAADARVFEPSAALRLPAAVAALEARGLTRGYASYWDASPITWNSDGRVTVFPATEDADCGSSSTTGALCGWSLNSESGWYTPQAGGGSFVIVDPENDYMRTAPSEATFGAARDVFTVGDLRCYVYDYDVAARFLHTCGGRSDHGC